MGGKIEGSTGYKLINFCKTKKRVVIYGAGHVGKIVEGFLRRENIAVDSFCVTVIDEKETFLGYPVKEIGEIQRDYKDAGIIVAVSKRFSEEVLGRVKNMQYFYDKSLLQEIELENAMKEAEERTKEVKVEGQVLCSVGEYTFCRDNLYLLCPGSIGDTIYVASLVKEYKRKNKVESVVLIVRKNQESIGELFSSIDGRIVSDELVEILDLYFRSKKIWELDNYRYGFARRDLAYRSYMLPYIGKNLLSAYKVAIMGLQEEVKYEEMQIDRTQSVADIYNDNTIIVMPHESSARRLPLSFWEELCRELSKNYTVYTNTKDETETPIKGTSAVSESLKDMTNICEQCFAVISIRTGMCDLLAFTKANLIVLNTESEQITAWNLKEVFFRKNIVNIDCRDRIDEEKLIKSIMMELEGFC